MNRFNLFLLLEGYLKGLYYSLSNGFNFKYYDSINRIVDGNNFSGLPTSTKIPNINQCHIISICKLSKKQGWRTHYFD